MSPRALVLTVIVLAGGVADADVTWDAAYGYGGGVEVIGGDTYTQGMLQIQIGRRVTSRLALSASAELASVEHDGIAGGVARGLLGLDLRVVRGGSAFIPDLLVSVGTGTETIMWDRGTLTRSLSYLGFEYRAGFEVSGDVFRNLKKLSFRFGVRGQVAPGIERDTVARLCSGCRSPASEPDRGLDLGIVGYLGLVFGR